MAGGVKRGRCLGLRFGGASMAGGAGVVSIRFVMTVWRQGAPLRSSVLGTCCRKRARLQQQHTVADRREGLSMAVGFIHKVDRQAGFRQRGRGCPT